jgi:hypothetical protein
MSKVETRKELSPEKCEKLLSTLKLRFEKNMVRHDGLEWSEVQVKLYLHAAREFRGSLSVGNLILQSDKVNNFHF